MHIFALVSELQRSSDELTSLCRLFIQTGDPKFKSYFEAVIGIRNGEVPRPNEYTPTYWDLVISGNLSFPDRNGTKVSLIELMRIQSDSKGINLLFNYPQSLPSYVLSDPSRIRQILFNLLGNAVKFTNSGTVNVSVKLKESWFHILV